MDPNEVLIREYYSRFNEHRFDDLEVLFTRDAMVEELPFRRRESGSEGRVVFAKTWLAAFPDAVFTIERVTGNSPLYDVGLVATGTHQGALDLGGWLFKATNTVVTLRLRELLEIQGGRIAASSLSFDLQTLVEQLAKVDSVKLLEQLSRIRRLGEELARLQRSPMPARDVIEQLGRELDAARHTVRPYFKR
jgi:SnoaL-like polyketide cyclase